ncbi:MAG: bifunctional 4-hydroxy-2-oxoglutarate aldolase/2-dehydro-3-deoxy-phosphogluconate aldolase [Sedimentisphaerales bacterium]|nr:bifunctional 4-hydroxy-2-oxoglutarate aldolase/2-dehydro-3-deoxy-phosphogluconate aldolase [Sedimentisphaerales bacterium]
MAAHSRLHTLLTIRQTGLVPLFYNPDLAAARSIVKACVDGGAVVVEFTNRADRAIEVFRELAELRDKELKSLVLGVGSVCDPATASMFINAGADFLVSPFLDEDIARVCNARKIPYLPGCGSLTEIHRAHLLGVEICKIFPADCVGGPAFVKAIKGPCPWADLMPTGGVAPTMESLSGWFQAGVACVGMGSNLISQDLVQKRDYAVLAERVRRALGLIRQIRGGQGVVS